VWENLLGRLNGPLNFRLIVQPVTAIFLAIRAGLKDAKQDRPAFLWAAITNGSYRREFWQQFRSDVWKVFTLAVVLDAIYQLVVHRGVYVLEVLLVATTLALIPYALFRGPIARIAKISRRKRAK